MHLNLTIHSVSELKPLLQNFFAYEKHVGLNPGSSNSNFQDLVTDRYTNHQFENRTFVWVQLIFFLFSEFDFIRLSNSIELNP